MNVWVSSSDLQHFVFLLGDLRFFGDGDGDLLFFTGDRDLDLPQACNAFPAALHVEDT
jgi:hypothetical protein